MSHAEKMLAALRKRNMERGIRAPEGLPEGMQTRAFEFIPNSWNEADQSVEAVLATENRVNVWDWQRFEVIEEVLRMDGLVDELPKRVPLLDSHQKKSVDHVLGSTIGRIEEVDGVSRLVGRRTFAKGDEKAQRTAAKVRDGHITDGSIGYRVLEGVWVEKGEVQDVGGRSYPGPVRVATRWKWNEDSVTPVGADGDAKTRGESFDKYSADATRRRYLEDREMNEKLRKRLEALGLRAEATEDEAWAFFEKYDLAKKPEGGTPTPASPAPIPAPAGDDATREAGRLEERARVSDITTFAELAGNAEMGRQFIAEATPTEEARTALFEWAKKEGHLKEDSAHAGEPEGGSKRIEAMDDKAFIRSLSRPVLFAPEVRRPDGPITMMEMRQLAMSEPDAWADKMRKCIDSGELGWHNMKDLKSLQEALQPVQVTEYVEVDGQERAITSAAFPVLCGRMTVNRINAAYDKVPMISDQLVEDMDDGNDTTVIAQINPLDSKAESYLEGDKYPEITANEETVEIRHKEWGRMVTITQRMIRLNQVGDIIRKVDALGSFLGKYVEKLTISRVCDQYGSASTEPYVYRPKGTGTALYNATANNPGTRAPSGTSEASNALADYTDLDKAEVALAAMLDQDGDPLPMDWAEIILLIPHALLGLSTRLLNSELIPEVTSGMKDATINHWGPRGIFRPKVLSSVRLDAISSSTWFLGNFKAQFLRKYAKRMEYVTLGENTESFLQRGIAWQGRIAVDVEVGATDYVYVTRCTA